MIGLWTLPPGQKRRHVLCEALCVLEQESVARIGKDRKLRIRDRADQCNRILNRESPVLIAIGNQNGDADCAQLLERTALAK